MRSNHRCCALPLIAIVIVLPMICSCARPMRVLWERRYGGSTNLSGDIVVPLPDGGFIIGYSASGSTKDDSDIGLLRLSESGDSVWVHTYPAPGRNKILAIRPTADNGFLVVKKGGETISFIKTDGSGAPVWTRLLGGLQTYCAAAGPTTDKGVVVAAAVNEDDLYLAKIGARGDTLWTRKSRGPDALCPDAVLESRDGGIVVAGCSQGGSFLLKTDAVGKMLWSRSIGTVGFEIYAGRVTRDDGFILCGGTNASAANPHYS